MSPSWCSRCAREYEQDIPFWIEDVFVRNLN
jgi:hypothetical protein